jgi:hypothetical protein
VTCLTARNTDNIKSAVKVYKLSELYIYNAVVSPMPTQINKFGNNGDVHRNRDEICTLHRIAHAENSMD